MSSVPFVTVEGVDGSGKSSHIEAIAKEMREAGWEVVIVREPGGTVVGEKIRDIILNEKMEPDSQILLAFASRSILMDTVIRPNLARGVAVLCDRGTDSTYAYQVAGERGNHEMVVQLEKEIQRGLAPTATLIFDLPVEISRERLNKTQKVPDQFESKDDCFFARVRGEYLKMAASNPRFTVIDSSQPLLKVSQDVVETIKRVVPKKEILNKKPLFR